MKLKNKRPVIDNRRIRHEYFVEETIDCGISLRGNEIKSVISGSCNLNEAWCSVENGQLIIHNMYIAKYNAANTFDVDERRNRVLLAHKSEIKKLAAKAAEKGYTLAPVKLYWDRQFCKITIGVCKGKHTYDKRHAIKERDDKRYIERVMKSDRKTNLY